MDPARWSLVSYSVCFFLTLVSCDGMLGSSSQVAPKEDLTECTWCVKQLAKEIMTDGVDEIEVRLRLGRQDVEKLDNFVNVEDSWLRLQDILRLVDPGVYPKDYEELSLRQGLSPSVIIVMSTGGVTLCAMWMILSRQSVCLVVVLLLLLSFSIGVAWNWWKIYNEEYSKRVTLLPEECKTQESSWYHSVKGFLIDPNCEEYFKAPVDDPVAMVSPHQVIKETIAMIFISPITMAASTFASFIHSLTDNLVWPLNWILQAVLTVILLGAGTVLAITLLAGLFNLNLKFSTVLVSGELKPTRTTKAANPSLPPPKRRQRPTDLSLFPSPPSPFR